MTISEALFKAVLAMDSYNRGYDRALEIPLVANSTQVGAATIIVNSSEVFDNLDQDIGFYALAYDWNGETVISYRGTDYPENGTAKDNLHGGLYH